MTTRGKSPAGGWIHNSRTNDKASAGRNILLKLHSWPKKFWDKNQASQMDLAPNSVKFG